MELTVHGDGKDFRILGEGSALSFRVFGAVKLSRVGLDNRVDLAPARPTIGIHVVDNRLDTFGGDIKAAVFDIFKA